jgi:hypothetical protein
MDAIAAGLSRPPRVRIDDPAELRRFLERLSAAESTNGKSLTGADLRTLSVAANALLRSGMQRGLFDAVVGIRPADLRCNRELHAALRQAVHELPASMAKGSSLSAALYRELCRFASTIWLAWRDDDSPPPDASRLRVQLFRAMKAHRGEVPSERTIRRAINADKQGAAGHQIRVTCPVDTPTMRSSGGKFHRFPKQRNPEVTR